MMRHIDSARTPKRSEMRKLKSNISKYLKLKEKIESLESVKHELNVLIKEDMSTFGLNSLTLDFCKAVYYSAVRDNFDTASFREDHLRLYERYNTATNYTYLRVGRITSDEVC